MYWETALSSSIEVAIGIAGFSGIIAVFGRKPGEKWAIDDVLRLQMLLTASAIAALFSFLPFVLSDTDLNDAAVWRIGSGLQILWFVSISTFRLRQASLVKASPNFGMTRIMFPFFIVCTLLQLANAFVYATAWLYVVGVIYQLAVGFGAFVSLLLGRGIGVGRDEST